MSTMPEGPSQPRHRQRVGGCESCATPSAQRLQSWPAQTAASLTMAAALTCRLPSSRVWPRAATTARLIEARAISRSTRQLDRFHSSLQIPYFTRLHKCAGSDPGTSDPSIFLHPGLARSARREASAAPKNAYFSRKVSARRPSWRFPAEPECV